MLGFVSLKVSSMVLVSSSGNSLPFHIGFLVSLLLALPSIVDWTTQSLGFRQSNNVLRLAMGFLEGLGIGLLSLLEVSAIAKLLILTSIGLGVLCVGTLGRGLLGASKKHLR